MEKLNLMVGGHAVKIFPMLETTRPEAAVSGARVSHPGYSGGLCGSGSALRCSLPRLRGVSEDTQRLACRPQKTGIVHWSSPRGHEAFHCEMHLPGVPQPVSTEP